MTSRLTILMVCLIFSLSAGLSSQPAEEEDSQLFFYRIWFTDKGPVAVSQFFPSQLLSPAAVARRAKCGIDGLDINDLPVSQSYINAIIQKGLTYRCSSKWMNTALFSSASSADTKALEGLLFVSRVQLVKHPAEPGKNVISKYGVTQPAGLSDGYDPNVPLNGTALHQSGFNGRHVTIAVLDAGFLNADVIESLEPLRRRNGIKATRDFVTGKSNVFGYHTHGTSVLSILAGSLPGIISGTATGADYLLLRTEDDGSEFPVEEDYWAAAAEYSDSAGADIISSSLGYCTFDDPALNYSFSEMDGNSTFVTRAADIAASKGILVVASAGNERNKEWIRILAPSDGDSVLSIGAVKHDLTIADFSSAGYSSDGQVKPDVVAPGVSLPLQYEPGPPRTGSGTSFSCPVISGLCASLMQAVPNARANDVAEAVRQSADRYSNPDTLYGYGLPDFVAALSQLEEKYTFRPEVIMTAGPNPFHDKINIWFRNSPSHLSVSVTDASGRTVMQKTFKTYAGRSFILEGFDNRGQGIYYVTVRTDQSEQTFKMIRVRR